MEIKSILGCFALSIVLIFGACNTTTIPKKILAYEHPILEAKDYIIIAPIILKAEISKKKFPQLTFINGRLMEAAIKMGGHDVINIRYDYTSDGRIIAVTAIVIKYINNVDIEKIE